MIVYIIHLKIIQFSLIVLVFLVEILGCCQFLLLNINYLVMVEVIFVVIKLIFCSLDDCKEEVEFNFEAFKYFKGMRFFFVEI